MNEFNRRLLDICHREWKTFGEGTIDANGGAFGGIPECSELVYRRVGDYWRSLEPTDTRDGRSIGVDSAWSAAFISFCMKQAGADRQFPYHEAHRHYINQAIENAKQGRHNAPIVGKRLSEYVPKVGDLLGCWRCRESEPNCPEVTFDNALNSDDYASHTDIFVEVNVAKRYAYIIGGNVENSVRRAYVHLNDNGLVIDTRRNWFVIIQSNIQ